MARSLQSTPAKHTALADRLRTMIVSGRYAAGQQLPTWDEMGQQFDVSRTTLMRAVESLKRQGFVHSSRGSGTFVADRPPHLVCYALVLPMARGVSRWPAFFDALTHECQVVARENDTRFEVFEGISRPTSTADYERLVEAVETHRFAGMIFVWPQNELRNSPLLTAPLVRRAYIMAPPDFRPQVQPDYHSFIVRSVQRLKQLGRRRIAVIGQHHMMGDFASAIASAGMHSRSCWRLSYPVDTNCAGLLAITELLFSGRGDDRPDGLVVADENHVEHVLRGITATDLRVGGDVDVVAHSSLPTPLSVGMPVHRLGFDARQLLRTAVSFLTPAAPASDAAPPYVQLPAVFEEELDIGST